MPTPAGSAPVRIVLLADEQRIMREALRALLEREGFDVVGEAWVDLEAARMARELRPDVTVLDLVLPIGRVVEKRPVPMTLTDVE